MSNPNQIVAERTVVAMEAQDLLLATSTKRLAEKLAAGRLSATDWITLFTLDAKTRKQNVEDETQKH